MSENDRHSMDSGFVGLRSLIVYIMSTALLLFMSHTKAYNESVGMIPTPPFRMRSITGSRRHASEPSSFTST
eukprot:1194967-Prorocentrum_minimum.AAC.2